MRKLVLLVCTSVITLATAAPAGIIPSWDSPSGRFGFHPVCNEFSFYQNYDDAGENRGRTLQIISINSFKLFTTFSFELTADYNFEFYPDEDRNHYVELSLVKPLTSLMSVNVQRIIATCEPEPINQFGLRLSL